MSKEVSDDFRLLPKLKILGKRLWSNEKAIEIANDCFFGPRRDPLSGGNRVSEETLEKGR